MAEERPKPALGPGQGVSVIIPTRGKPGLLRNCLIALYRAAARAQVIVVQHVERDLEALKQPPAFAEFVAEHLADENASYSGLNNHGAALAKGEYLLLLNNDVVLDAAAVRRMVEVLDQDPTVGIVGAKLLLADGRIQHVGVVFDAFGIPSHLGYGSDNGPGFPPSMRSDYFHAATFACALIRRSLWEKLGGLDTDYFFNYEDVDFCLRAAEAGFKTYVTMKAVGTHLEGQSGDHRKTTKHSRLRNLHVFRKKWIVNGRLPRVIGSRVIADYGPLTAERRNIAIMPGGRGAGIAWWRLVLPGRKILEKKLANVEFIYGDMDERAVMNLMGKADLAVWQSYSSEAVKRMATLGPGRGHRMIYEVDDHPVYLSPYCQAYRALGTREQRLRSTKDGSEVWLWRDGENGFDLERNRQNRTRQLEILAACDGITTSTDPLASYLRTLNSKVFTLPNAVDLSLYPAPSKHYDRKPGPVRIGWWGGDNHWHDVSVIGKALTDYVNAHDVRLVLLGAFYQGPLAGIDRSKVEEMPWVHVEAFSFRLATAALDVVVIPLANPALPEMQFNSFKSDIKYLESSALRWPSLVQGGVRPYEACIDGRNALTFLDDAEFTEKLDRLVKDAALRSSLADAAYEYVYEYRNLDREIEKWMEAYESVIRGGGAIRARATFDEVMKDVEAVPEAVLQPAVSNAVPEGSGA